MKNPLARSWVLHPASGTDGLVARSLARFGRSRYCPPQKVEDGHSDPTCPEEVAELDWVPACRGTLLDGQCGQDCAEADERQADQNEDGDPQKSTPVGAALPRIHEVMMTPCWT